MVTGTESRRVNAWTLAAKLVRTRATIVGSRLRRASTFACLFAPQDVVPDAGASEVNVEVRVGAALAHEAVVLHLIEVRHDVAAGIEEAREMVAYGRAWLRCVQTNVRASIPCELAATHECPKGDSDVMWQALNECSRSLLCASSLSSLSAFFLLHGQLSSAMKSLPGQEHTTPSRRHRRKEPPVPAVRISPLLVPSNGGPPQRPTLLSCQPGGVVLSYAVMVCHTNYRFSERYCTNARQIE